jgi:spore coat protein U-like protein
MNFLKSTHRHLAGAAALTLAMAGASSTATAATATGTLSVTASVSAVCIIGNATLAFGAYNPTSATAATANTTVTLTCSLGTPYNIGMSVGAGSGATTNLRVMTATSGTLGYKLFRDSGYTLNWGNTVGTDTLSGTSSASSLSNTINIYGQIPAGETAAIGTYTDTVTMTVTY